MKYKVELDNGEHVCYINQQLVSKQEIDDDTLEHIKELHKLNAVHCKTLAVLSKDRLKEWNALWTDIQFALQDAWGFPLNAAAHRFWNIPGCSCGKLDNDGNWPTGWYSMSGDCPVHGYLIKGELQ